MVLLGTIAKAADVFAAGLLAGILVMSAWAALPAAADLGTAAQIRFRQQLIRRLAVWMPPLMTLPVAASLTVVAFTRPLTFWPLEALSGAFSVITVGITVAVNGRLSGRFAQWSPDAPPRCWERDVRRWDLAHAIRTAAAVAAFAFAICASG